MPTHQKESPIFQEVRPYPFVVRQVRKGKRPPLQCGAHVHPEIELIFLENGQAIAYADTLKATMNSGDVFFAFPNQIHAFETIDPNEEYTLLIAKTEILPEYQGIFEHCTPLFPIIANAGSLPRVKKLFQLLLESEKDHALSLELAGKRRCGYLLALVSELLLHMELRSEEIQESRTMQAVLQYCAEHFSQNISLSSIVEELHLSRCYLSHLFNEQLGVHFKDYIHSLRISEACRLLINTNEELIQISEAVGYSSYRTFNRAFIKQVGMLPSQYRRAEASRVQVPHFSVTSGTSRILESADKVIKG